VARNSASRLVAATAAVLVVLSLTLAPGAIRALAAGARPGVPPDAVTPPGPSITPPAGEAAAVALADPRGLAADSASRTLVAEAAADRVVVFDRSGRRLAAIGRTGAGTGQFRQPWDLAVDAHDRFSVADRGNNRVQVFDRTGGFVRQLGGLGTAPGRLQDPQGLAVDPGTGRLYVADTGNQRVQRFRADGTLDPGWGDHGMVGVTGQTRHDHSGFDQPSDVAVNPVSGLVYVADRNNQRLEVFDGRGRYVHTFHAVFQANGLAFDRQGNLYVAGDDPNENYVAFDGRLRLLAAGEALLSRHYTGGLDDLGRVVGGVAFRPDGRIVASDPLHGRLVATDAAFTVPVHDLTVDARGTQATFRWKTAVAGPSQVRIGPPGLPGAERLVGATRAVTTHAVTVTGLIPDTRLSYGVSFLGSFDHSKRFTPSDLLNTGVPPGRTPFLRLKGAGVIYTDIQPGPGYTRMSPESLAQARARLQRVAAFYWRNSRFRLWLDITVVEVDRDVTDEQPNLFASMEPDLATLGFGPADDFDAAWGTSTFAVGNFGGGSSLFGRFVGMSEWVQFDAPAFDDFVAIHEINHSIDAIYDSGGLRKYEFNHGLWAIPNSIGHQLAVNAQILRNLLPVNFTATQAPFSKHQSAPDADSDGVPDRSPPGLTVPLAVTEATLGSSTSSNDTDGDGLGDRAEATALPFHATNPRVADSDGDGIRDGADPNPAYRMHDHIAKATPTIDGVIGAGEPWTVLTDHTGFTNDALVNDNNAVQDRVTTYAAWDDRFLYLALQGPPTVTEVAVDGRADNRFISPDNYSLRLGNGSPLLEVAVNVGVPDLFKMIDNDGGFSEFFDTNPQFTKPYLGHRILGPDDGLGFPGRLVTEADLRYQQRPLSPDSAVWEVAIPWSKVTSFHGGVGKQLALGFNVDGDLLFETDHTPTVTLVAA